MAVFTWVAAILLIVSDQLTKFAAVKYLSAVDSVVVLDGVLSLTLVRNEGAAFGIFQGGRWFFVVLTFVVVGFIMFYYKSLPRTKTAAIARCSLVMIAAGACGNFLDRLRNGYVIDFIHVRFIDFPVFNLADIYVVAGTFTLAVITLFFMKEEQGGPFREAEPPDEMPAELLREKELLDKKMLKEEE